MFHKKPVVAVYGLWKEMQPAVRAQLKQVSLHFYNEPLTTDNAHKDAQVVAVFVESRITRQVLDRLPNLSLIAAMSTGYDHIDMVAAKKKRIAVVNVPTYGENTVAEHTMALLLGLTRKLFDSVRRVKDGVYDFHGLRGVDLQGKVIGVVGTGHIGSHVIRMAKCFGMQVVAHDAFPSKKLAQELGFTYVSLMKLLAASDVVTLHTPLLRSTRHLINHKNIGKIKQGAYVINTARGGLIEPEALVWGLESGRLAGVGLDVLEEEDLMQDEEKLISGAITPLQIRTSLLNRIIINHPNAIVTPHNAFNSQEAIGRIVQVTVENIISFLRGTVKNKVG